VRNGKRGNGEVAAFEYHLERNYCELKRELREGTYLPGGYHHFFIYEPNKRKINEAPFRDRVVHHALSYVHRVI
jgi:RNA-directed DNA polymerase